VALGGTGGGGGGSASAVRAGRAFVEVSANDDLLTRGLQAAERKLHAWGKTVRNIGLGISGVGGVVLAPITAAFGEMLAHFSDVQKAAGRLFTTPEIASGLGYALGGLEEMEHAARHLQRAIAENKPAFAELGLSAAKLKGLNLEEQFLAVGDALDKIDDPTKKVAVAFELLGRQGASLASKLTGAGLREKIGRAGLVGEVVSSEDAANALKVSKLFSDLGKAIKNTWREVGASLLAGTDVFALYADKVLLGIKAVRDWLHEHRALVLTVALTAAGVVALGAAVTGLGVGMQVAGSALAGLAKLISLVGAAAGVAAGAITSPFTILVALAGALVGSLIYAEPKVRGFFTDLAADATSAFGAISSALQGGEIQLAWKVVTTGLALEWKRLILLWREEFGGFGGFFDRATDAMVFTAKRAFNALLGEARKAALEFLNFLQAEEDKDSDEQLRLRKKAIDLETRGKGISLDIERAREAANRPPPEDLGEVVKARQAVADAQADFEKARAAAAAVPAPGAKPPERPAVPSVGLELGTAAGAFSSGDFRQLLGGGKVEQQQLNELKGISGRLEAGFEVLREVKDVLKLGTGGFF
jgi:hypothetical protein